MKPCDKHWSMMRAAVEARGLTHLIKTPEIIAAEMRRQLGEVTDERGNYDHEANVKLQEERAARAPTSAEAAHAAATFDPLMTIYWMTMNRAMEMGGLYLMTAKPDGTEYCPVCEAMENMASVPLSPGGPPVGAEWVERFWIDGPADAAHQQAVALGVVAKS